jgi:Gram-negative bacterial TonB protein C-terminal
MKNFILLLVFFCSFTSFSQIMGENEVYLKGDLIQPKFNGAGIEAFRDYVYAHIDKTKVKQAGKVVFTLDISETGEVKNIRIVEFKDMDFAMEVIRVLKLTPKWQPALRGGKAVSTSIKFPIEYKIKLKQQL